MDTKALRQEFMNAQKEAHDLLSAAAVAKRDLTAEEKEANDRRYARMDQIHKQFAEMRKFAALALDQGDIVTPADPAERSQFERQHGRDAGMALAFKNADGTLHVENIKEGLRRFARSGDTRHLFTVTTGTASGAFLPKQVLQPVTVRRLQNCWRGVLAAFSQEAIEIETAATFELPVADDTSNTGQTTSESATSATSVDPDNTGSITIAPTLYDSKGFWYSNTMVMASVFDVVAYTLPMAQLRIQKAQESAWTTNVTSNGTVGTTTASAAAIAYAELLNWEHSLLPAYRSDAAFVLSDGLLRGVRGLVDGVQRPIFDEDPTNVFQGKIHGKPVIIGDYFSGFGDNNILGAFVSASAIKIVDVQDARLARYSNLPTYPDQIGFEMFQNGDFGFVKKGLSLLKAGAS